jgi:hypothetical protein
MQEMKEMKKTQEMLKVLRDGKVAVLYSPGYGAGWYTWDIPLEGVFHPEIVEAVEREADEDELVTIATRLFGEEHYYGGAGDLTICWIPEGVEFQIEEYDGSEGIIIKDEQRWIKA